MDDPWFIVNFSLPASGLTVLRVFDYEGWQVREWEEPLPAGVHEVEIDMAGLPEDLYHVTLSQNDLEDQTRFFLVYEEYDPAALLEPGWWHHRYTGDAGTFVYGHESQICLGEELSMAVDEGEWQDVRITYGPHVYVSHPDYGVYWGEVEIVPGEHNNFLFAIGEGGMSVRRITTPLMFPGKRRR